MPSVSVRRWRFGRSVGTPDVAAPPGDLPAPDRARSPHLALRLIRAVLTVASIGFLAAAVAARWDQVTHDLSRIPPLAVAAAFCCSMLGLSASMLGWRALLADLGSPLTLAAATRVLFLGQLAKYLPGSGVWAMVAQTELARDYGVPRRRAASASLVLSVVTLAVGALVALLALPDLVSSPHEPAYVRWAPLLVPVGLVFLAPPVLTRLCDAALRLLRRSPLDQAFTWPGLARTASAQLCSWLFNGLQVAVIGVGLGAHFGSFVVPATGGFAAAWCVGFLIVVVPTGAGPREAVLTLVLAAHLPGGSAAALTLAIVSRLVLMAADVATALIGFGIGGRRGSRRPPGPVPPR